MADTKLSALTALAGSGFATGDLFELVDVSDTTMAASGTNKKAALSDLLTFLRANGLPERLVTGSSTTNSSNTTPTDVTGASFSVGVGTYWFKFRGRYQSAATTTGVGFTFSGPATSAVAWGAQIRQAAAGTDQMYTDTATALTTVVVSASVVAANTDYEFEVEGHATFTASGTLQLRCRSEVNASQITIQSGTIGLLIQVA